MRSYYKYASALGFTEVTSLATYPRNNFFLNVDLYELFRGKFGHF